jgi:hypothetical protein
VDPDIRNALLIGGLVFCTMFGAMTAFVAIEYGFDVLTVAAILILVLLVLPLAGALRHPPED